MGGLRSENVLGFQHMCDWRVLFASWKSVLDSTPEKARVWSKHPRQFGELHAPDSLYDRRFAIGGHLETVLTHRFVPSRRPNRLAILRPVQAIRSHDVLLYLLGKGAAILKSPFLRPGLTTAIDSEGSRRVGHFPQREQVLLDRRGRLAENALLVCLPGGAPGAGESFEESARPTGQVSRQAAESAASHRARIPKRLRTLTQDK